MPQPHRATLKLEQPERWSLLAAEGNEAGAGLASSPLAMPGFFTGWIVTGVLIGLWLARRGHDRNLMVALGTGLGPMMVVVASDSVRRRDPTAEPTIVEHGVNRGGDLDVLVLLHDHPDDVRSLVSTLQAIRTDLGKLVLARTVPYESINDDPSINPDPHPVVADAASASLVEARAHLPYGGAQLELHPGTPAQAARRFARRSNRTIVLYAIGEASIGARADTS